MINTFEVWDKDINIEYLKKELLDSTCGAYVSFEGWIRNNNDGKSVLKLEYEVYEKMAIKEAQKIFNESREKFQVVNLSCIHRKGLLNIGDIAIYIGVTSFHRGSAFKACEYIINQIKIRLPIWKKEYYTDDHSEWVNCKH